MRWWREMATCDEEPPVTSFWCCFRTRTSEPRNVVRHWLFKITTDMARVALRDLVSNVGQDCILRAGFLPALSGLARHPTSGLQTRCRLQTCPTTCC